MAKLLCKKHLSERKNLEVLLACQLMPLNKSPGKRAIEIEEDLRQIMGETIILTIEKNVVQPKGSLQVRSRCRVSSIQHGRSIPVQWVQRNSSD